VALEAGSITEGHIKDRGNQSQFATTCTKMAEDTESNAFG